MEDSDLVNFFKKWLSLENLTFWEKGQSYLFGNNNTNCKNKSINNCSKNNKCSIYRKKKCVSKNIIHHFKEGEPIKNQLFGKNYLIKNIYISDEVIHKIIFDKIIQNYFEYFNDSLKKNNIKNIFKYIEGDNRNLFVKLLLKETNNLTNEEIIIKLKNLKQSNFNYYRELIKEYFRIIKQNEYGNYNNNNKKNYISNSNSQKLFFYQFHEIDSDNIYLIFPAGEILYDLYDSKYFLHHYFDHVLEYILQLNFNNIILGGHSMGCVYAQYIGNLLLKKNLYFFESKIWIVGTAPFKWIKPEDLDLYNSYFLRKILIFGLVEEDKIDKFIINGETNLLQSNIYILEYSLEEDSINNDKSKIIINYDKSKIYSYAEINEKIKNNIWFIDNHLTTFIHMFKNYQKVIYNFLVKN